MEMLYIFFYLWYAIEWLVRLIQCGNARQAYYNISLEKEAYYNMYNLAYIDAESCDNFEPIEYENEITEKTEDGGTPCILHKKEG